MIPEQATRRIVPISLLAIPLAVAAYAIQTVPIIGVFLMMMFAVAWSGVLLLAGLCGTVVEAMLGRVSRWWLVLPLAVLGVYEGFALADHVHAWRLVEDGPTLESISAGDRSIVVIGEHSSDLAQQLVQTRITNPVHQAIVEDGKITRYLSRQLVPKSDCRMSSSRSDGHLITTSGFHVPHGPYGQPVLDPGACVLTMDDVPTSPSVAIHLTERRRTVDRLPITTRTAILRMDGKTRSTIIEHVSRPLSWTPLVLAGCGLGSASPSWDCGIMPLRDTIGNPSGAGMVERIASVLRLPIRPHGAVPSADVGSIVREAASRVAADRERTDRRYADLLDRLIADPATVITTGDLDRMAVLPSVVGPRLLALENMIRPESRRTSVVGRVPTRCVPEDGHPICRERRMAASAVGIYGLLQWRIRPSALNDGDRSALHAIRRRMAERTRRDRREADERRMERISALRREDAIAQRDGR
jgi:hypothetical protein